MIFSLAAQEMILRLLLHFYIYYSDSVAGRLIAILYGAISPVLQLPCATLRHAALSPLMVSAPQISDTGLQLLADITITY